MRLRLFHRNRGLRIELRHQLALPRFKFLHPAVRVLRIPARICVLHEKQRRLRASVEIRIAAAVEVSLRQCVGLEWLRARLAVHEHHVEPVRRSQPGTVGKLELYRQDHRVDYDRNSQRKRERPRGRVEPGERLGPAMEIEARNRGQEQMY